MLTLDIIGLNSLGYSSGYEPEYNPFYTINELKTKYIERVESETLIQESNETINLKTIDNQYYYIGYSTSLTKNIEKISEILSTILKFQKTYGIDSTLDYIYYTFEDLLFQKDFEVCNTILSIIDLSDFEDESLLGLLSITSAWKNQLAMRNLFFSKVNLELKKRHPAKEVSELLFGLE